MFTSLHVRAALRAVSVFAAAAFVFAAGCSATPSITSELTRVTQQGLGTFNVLQRCYDNTQTCANLSETVINQTRVKNGGPSYGPITPADNDRIFAQPLYASGVSIGGTNYNVLYVATMANNVYAYNVGSLSTITTLWSGTNYTNTACQAAFGTSTGCTPGTGLSVGASGCGNYTINQGPISPPPSQPGNVGIVGAPVIDGSSAPGTMYFVTLIKNSTSHASVLHAVDITTGAEKAGSPVNITASALGFNAKYENQRPALALALVNGNVNVYIGYAGFCDNLPPTGGYGYLFAYNASTLAQVAVFSTVPNPNTTPSQYGGGGIWQSGAGPAIDASGNVYVAVGNAYYDGTTNWGESLLKFAPGLSGGVRSSFTPYDYATMSDPNHDWDLAVGPPTLLPNGSTQLLQGDKEGRVWLLNQSSLGGVVSTSCGSAPCYFTAVSSPPDSYGDNGQIHQTVVYNDGTNTNVYVWGYGDSLGDQLKRYQLSTSAPASLSLQASWGSGPDSSAGGGWMSLSANGTTSGSAILWGVGSSNQQASTSGRSVYAFTPLTLQQLWSASLGVIPRWIPPLVANGTLYVVTGNSTGSTNSVTPYQFPCGFANHPWVDVCGICQPTCASGSCFDNTRCACVPGLCQ